MLGKLNLGLPFFGERLPPGGIDEIARRQSEDYVLQLLLPTIEQAVSELPDVIEALRSQFNMQTEQGIGLFGFSAGGAAALLALTESKVTIAAAVLAGVAKNLLVAVDTVERFVNVQYRWTEADLAVSERLDFEARAGEIATGTPPPAILFLHGGYDTVYSPEQVQDLYTALLKHYEPTGNLDRLAMQLFPHLGHQIEPPSDPTNSVLSAEYVAFQKAASDWFQVHLTG